MTFTKDGGGKMKKFFAVFAVLGSMGLNAELLKLDSRFIQDAGERNIRGWKFNAVKSYEPFGDVNAVMKNGVAGVRLASKGKPTTIYLNDRFAVSTGDYLTVSAMVCGKGSGSIGVFQYGERWKWMKTQGDTFKVDATEPYLVRQRIVIPPGVSFVRPSITSASGEVFVFGFQVEKGMPK